jgi:hypothetical protein
MPLLPVLRSAEQSWKCRAAGYAFTTYPLGSLAFGVGITPPPGAYVTDAGHKPPWQAMTPA